MSESLTFNHTHTHIYIYLYKVACDTSQGVGPFNGSCDRRLQDLQRRMVKEAQGCPGRSMACSRQMQNDAYIERSEVVSCRGDLICC